MNRYILDVFLAVINSYFSSAFSAFLYAHMGVLKSQMSINRPPVWEIAVHLAVACDVYDGVFLCCPFFPRHVLDEILNLIESVSESFPTYSYVKILLVADRTGNHINFQIVFGLLCK